jgi:sec-independent protein translocase protein TatC
LLFAGGAALAYYFIFPLAWKFFLSFETPSNAGMPAIELQARVAEYLSLALELMLAFGLCFQMPIILLLLAKIGIVSASTLKKGRRYAIVIIFIVAAIATPPDVLSQISLALPLLALYEISIIGCRWLEPKENLVILAEALNNTGE